MIRLFIKYLLLLAMLTPGIYVYADDATAKEAIEKSISRIFKNRASTIHSTAIDNIYEVQIGSKYFYVTADGRYLIDGDMFDLSTVTNMTEFRRGEARQAAMQKLDEKTMIVYKAKGEEKHVITVFTDIDCGYCRKLHSGMDEMNSLGITVRYMAYPRAGVDSDSYIKAVGVWCADDQKKAMDIAKKTGKVANRKSCDNPVIDHMTLGGEFGVTGTPAILLSSGTLIPGYQPPGQLLKTLESH